MQILAKKNFYLPSSRNSIPICQLKKKMSSLKKNLESFKGGNADGNKRDMKAIQGCWKRMKLQTKKKFDEQWRERKKTGGGKAPASPNAISKLVADGIPASGQQPCD